MKRNPPRAFVLFEVVLATTIFAIVMLGLAAALNETLSAVVRARRESDIRLTLESLLAAAREKPLQPGREDLKVSQGNAKYAKEVKLLELENRERQKLGNLYLLTITAKWTAEGMEEKQVAQLEIYQP